MLMVCFLMHFLYTACHSSKCLDCPSYWWPLLLYGDIYAVLICFWNGFLISLFGLVLDECNFLHCNLSNS